MANPPKKKGTAGETELLGHLGPRYHRTAPTLPYDIRRAGHAPAINSLATRPDRGQWLVTVDLPTFMELVGDEREVHVEVKRYKRFSIHEIWRKKFGNG